MRADSKMSLGRPLMKLWSRKIASGIANPACVNHTAVVVPVRERSGNTAIVLSMNGSVWFAPPL